MEEREEIHLKAEILKKEGHEVTLRVEAEPEDLKEIIGETYKEISRTISVPGFRKGKVPRAVIDSRIGAENVFKKAVEKGLPVLYLEGVRQSGISPVSDPEFTRIETPENSSVVFEARVDVKPEIEVRDYKGIEIERPDTSVTDDDVERAVMEARERFATLEVIEGRPISEGDFVLFDYKAFADGMPEEGSSGSDILIEVGAEDFLPGFDTQLIGAKKGDIIDVVITFPPDYSVRELAGKPATFRTIIKELKTKVLPPLDEALVKQISVFDSVEDFKKDLREKIARLKEISGERQIRQAVVDVLVDRTYVDLPESMISGAIENEIEEFTRGLEARGVTLEQYMTAARITRYDLEKLFRPKVLKGLKAELILDAVAKAENIDVSEEEAIQFLKERVRVSGGDPDTVIEELRRRGRIPLIMANMRLGKAVDFLVDNAVFKGDSIEKAEKEEEGEMLSTDSVSESIESSSLAEEETVEEIDKGSCSRDEGTLPGPGEGTVEKPADGTSGAPGNSIGGEKHEEV